MGTSWLHRAFYSGCRGAGFSLRWFLLLQNAGSRAHGPEGVAAPGLYSTGSIVVMNKLICPVACGIFPNLVPRWQSDSLVTGPPGELPVLLIPFGSVIVIYSGTR